MLASLVVLEGVLFTGQWGVATAWGATGHDRINLLASELLTPKRREQVEELLLEELNALGSWEDATLAKHPSTRVLHFDAQEPEWTCHSLRGRHLGGNAIDADCSADVASRSTLFCALVYFFDHFAHEALLREYPESRKPIRVPDALPVVSNLPPDQRRPHHYLRWTVALLGDLHQPLHWLRGAYDYGRTLRVSWQGGEYSLMEFFEEYLPAHAEPMPKAKDVDKIFQERAMAWGYMTPPELFRNWAKVAAQAACSVVYEPMEAYQLNGTWEAGTPLALTEDMYRTWLQHVEAYSALGAERLAFVLQDILEHREHYVAHREGRGLKHRKSPWLRNLATNALIGVTIVPMSLWVFTRIAHHGDKFFKSSTLKA